MSTSTVAYITNALLIDRAILALPRWRVLLDIKARFGCCDSTACEAYALARVEGRMRQRRQTWPYTRAA